MDKITKTMNELRKAISNDPDYAWAWHCTISMLLQDNGIGHKQACKAATDWMRKIFQYDITTTPQYKAFGWEENE